MKKFLLFSLALLCLSTITNAKIIRVAYPGSAVAGVDFSASQASAAVAEASAGDTIQVYQQYALQPLSFGNITKQLVFIGFGYFLNKNPDLQAVASADNQYAQLSFVPGSEGSVVQGLYGYVYLGANDISISRCRFETVVIGANQNNQPVNVSGISIRSSFLSSVQDNGQGSNLYLANNILYSFVLNASSGFLLNNVMTSSVEINSFVVKNNIFTATPCFAQGSNIVDNNIFAGSCSYSGVGNQYGVDMSTVFTNWGVNGGFGLIYDHATGTYRDNTLSLSPSGPAKNAGVNGDGSVTDAGIFGGESGDIYRLSGIPAVPSIYKLTATSSTATQSPYNITVSVRSNN